LIFSFAFLFASSVFLLLTFFALFSASTNKPFSSAPAPFPLTGSPPESLPRGKSTSKNREDEPAAASENGRFLLVVDEPNAGSVPLPFALVLAGSFARAGMDRVDIVPCTDFHYEKCFTLSCGRVFRDV
jgi:hypothetical protein